MEVPSCITSRRCMNLAYLPDFEGNNKKKKKKMVKGNIRALVVDDDMTNRTIHKRLLGKLGVENQVARNGKEAVEIHRSGQFFDLILMDMDMPVMNGIEATKKLRAMGIRSMIAGVSTRSLKQEIEEFMDAGLDDYHEKPLNISKLISILHKIN